MGVAVAVSENMGISVGAVVGAYVGTMVSAAAKTEKKVKNTAAIKNIFLFKTPPLSFI